LLPLSPLRFRRLPRRVLDPFSLGPCRHLRGAPFSLRGELCWPDHLLGQSAAWNKSSAPELICASL
jgi:hypothetical protein